MITTTGDYVLIETEDVEFKSAHGVVTPKGLEKSGNGIKGIVLADHYIHKKGDKVELSETWVIKLDRMFTLLNRKIFF